MTQTDNHKSHADAVEDGAQAEKPRIWLWSQYALDCVAWIVAILLAIVLRLELLVERVDVSGLIIFCAVALLAQLVVGVSFALYRGRYAFGSFHEAKLLVLVTVIVSATLLLVGVGFFSVIQVPRSVAMIAFPFACMFMAATRYLKRMYVESKAKPGDDAQRTLIYGAGFLGQSLVTRMMQDPKSPYFPVGVVDDDPAKKRLRLATVPVLGRLEDLPALVRRTRATALVMAFSNVEAAQVRRVSDAVAGFNVQVLVLPPLHTMLTGGGGNELPDFREVAVEDLIGRRQVDIEPEELAGYISGRRVLVTGAGGSIGSELCRQIAGYGPAELIMLDRDETGLQTTQISLTGRGLLTGRDTVLADIRDADTLREIFLDRKPEVVFHAAALKHVSLLEQYPEEAWKTNVLGTLNVLQAAQAAGAGNFVNISTDKAASPTSVLGHSKRIAERLTAWAARTEGKKYVSVRFGNVIGSRGSMLPLFTEQIRLGGPITVTDPEVTRFFMTIPEACQVVIQAGAIGPDGEVLILDMGEPVKILDVAKRMIAMSGKEMDIVFTGLRKGEKLHENLWSPEEGNPLSLNENIFRTRVDPLDPTMLNFNDWVGRLSTNESPESQDLSSGKNT